MSGFMGFDSDLFSIDLELYFDKLAEQKGPGAVVELIERKFFKYLLFEVDEEKNDKKNLQRAVEKIRENHFITKIKRARNSLLFLTPDFESEEVENILKHLNLKYEVRRKQ